MSSFMSEKQYYNHIQGILKKNIEPDLLHNVKLVIESVVKIWNFDWVVRNYTSHRIDHNIRVVYFAYMLIDVFKQKIDKTGYYILTMACLLHDIGLQCTDPKILQKYSDIPLRSLSGNEKQTLIRKNHSRITVDWILKLYNKGEGDIGKLLGLIDPSHLKYICLIIQFHSGKEIFQTTEHFVYSHFGKEKDLLILILIMRLADELDIGHSRSSEESILFSELPMDHLIFFWLHYITNISFVTSNIIKISIEINPKDRDKVEIFKQRIYNDFKSKNAPLLELLNRQCGIYLAIEFEATENIFAEAFDPMVFDNLVCASVDEGLFSDVIDFTYQVPNIVDVFDLDSKLLPMLYNDSNHEYAVSKKKAIECSSINPYMTIAAYKKEIVIGYLTLWPVTYETLIKLMNFEMLESDIDVHRDILTYDKFNINICWYISGLGVSNEEKGTHNFPNLLYQMINMSLKLVKEKLLPNNICVEYIGAVVYTPTAERLCLKHFDMKIHKNADFLVDGFVPKSVLIKVSESNSSFLSKLQELHDSRRGIA